MIRFASNLHPVTTRFLAGGRRAFSDVAVPIRRKVTLEERAALRAERKKRSQNILQGDKASSSDSTGQLSAGSIKWLWYMSVIVPTGLFAWGYNDENSPPAKFSEWIGLTGFITHYTDEISKPSHEKLLPDWNEVSASKIYFLPLSCKTNSNFLHRCPTYRRIFLYRTH